MPNEHIHNIRRLISDSGFKSDYDIVPLPVSGSNRQYFRAFKRGDRNETLIASFNEDISENIAQYSFTLHFISLGFRVPEIIAKDSTYQYFLLHDLGKNALFDVLNTRPKEALEYYKQVVRDLVNFQIDGVKNLDMDVAYPVRDFNHRSIIWDLNYFKYYFAKPSNIYFNENRLEDDHEKFTQTLLQADNRYFCYRDFQSRNIVIYMGDPWYIDFQGGRIGPLQYDLVSLLNQVKANLSEVTKQVIYQEYLVALENKLPGKTAEFEKFYRYFEYFRLMQVLGAYGFRGLVQKKAHFLQSIVPAIEYLKKLLLKYPLEDEFPELNKILVQVSEIKDYVKLDYVEGLNVTINSFSYKKKGIPLDMTGNGGGHVFDCRSLPNPGRIPGLRDFTGLEKPIIDYLGNQVEVSYFLENTKKIVSQSIDNYLVRGFANLQINFGCTGGRHRSVYSANMISNFVREKYPQVNLKLKHNQLDK